MAKKKQETETTVVEATVEEQKKEETTSTKNTQEKVEEKIETGQSALLHEAKEEKKEEGFDVSQFVSYDKDKVEKPLDSNKDESALVGETKEENKEEEKEEGNVLSWDDIKIEEKKEKEEVKVENDPWENVDVVEEPEEEKKEEAPVEEIAKETDWESIAKELGVEGATKEDLAKRLAKPDKVVETDTTTKLEKFLDLNDKDLVKEELKAQGMEEGAVDENVDRLEDSGMLRYQANTLRASIKTAMKDDQLRAVENKKREEHEKEKGLKNHRNNLKDYLKNNDTFFGGKASEQERLSIYRDVCDGALERELYRDPATVSKVMFLLRNGKKLEKFLYNRGKEDGKAMILDSITSPDLGERNSPTYKEETTGFDAKSFIKR